MVPLPTRWLAVVLLAAHALIVPQAVLAEPAEAVDEHISIPLRWCAVRGSPTAEAPSKTGESTTDAVLRARHSRASVFVWMPEARISFRSALTNEMPNGSGFPLIDDPHPPNEDGTGGPGLEGDILDPRFDQANARELKLAIASCEARWEQLEDELNTNFEGIIAVNARRFVKPDGTPSHLLGVGSTIHTVPPGTDKCELPSDLATYGPVGSNDGWVIVQDYKFSFAVDPHDSALAHELGHVLFLGHGNGIDDPLGNPPYTNSRYDSFCDRQENVQAEPATLMMPKRPVPSHLSELQRGNARAVARVTVGAVVVKTGELEGGYLISDDEVDKVGDVKDRSVDLQSLGIKYDTRKGHTLIHFRLFGRLPPRPNHRFLIFADMDADPKTGGAPADLGFQTRFQGAEIVTEIAVRAREGDEQVEVVPTEWQYRSGDFVKLPEDAGIEAAVTSTLAGDTGKAAQDIVSVRFPHKLVSPRPVLVRFQASAERVGGEVDYIPQNAAAGRLIRLTKPVYPVCQAIPITVRSGDRFVIEATGFPSDREAHVLYNEELLGKGSTDQGGNMSFEFTVPDDTEDKIYLLVVREPGTALTAHCAVIVDSTLGVTTASGEAASRSRQTSQP